MGNKSFFGFHCVFGDPLNSKTLSDIVIRVCFLPLEKIKKDNLVLIKRWHPSDLLREREREKDFIIFYGVNKKTGFTRVVRKGKIGELVRIYMCCASFEEEGVGRVEGKL